MTKRRKELKNAVYGNNLETVKLLVSAGADVAADRNMLIIIAASNGHLEIVKFLISKGGNINSALGGAIRGNQLGIVEFLISNGANTTWNNSWGDIDYAYVDGRGVIKTDTYSRLVAEGKLEMIKVLAAAGHNFTSRSNVKLAVTNKHWKTVRYLISIGADYTGCGINKFLGVDRLPRTSDQVLSSIDMFMVNNE